MYTFLIVGAGYVGGAVARYFKSQKQKVYGLVQSQASAARLAADGIHAITADLCRLETLVNIPPAHFIIISVAPGQRDESSYQKTYLEGIGNFLHVQKKQKLRPSLIIAISSTGVWRDRKGDWVEDSSPADAITENGKILIQAEEQVLKCGMPSVILRLAGIYGPGRNRLESFQSGEWPKGGPDSFMNMIHLEDIVRALPVLLKSAEVGKIYTGVDDEPVLQSSFCQWLSQTLGGPHSYPPFDLPGKGKRCRNDSLKSLGFTFQHPDFRIGYANLLKDIL